MKTCAKYLKQSCFDLIFFFFCFALKLPKANREFNGLNILCYACEFHQNIGIYKNTRITLTNVDVWLKCLPFWNGFFFFVDVHHKREWWHERWIVMMRWDGTGLIFFLKSITCLFISNFFKCGFKFLKYIGKFFFLYTCNGKI